MDHSENITEVDSKNSISQDCTLSNGSLVKTDTEEGQEKAQMKKTMGFTSASAVIIGSVIGSGIFISPTGIIKNMHSFGASVIMWILCGIYSLMGAVCYAELGTMIPRSGADYSYVLEAFGPLLGFLRMWVEVVVVRPSSAAVIVIVFAKYILHGIYPTCQGPSIVYTIVAIMAVLTIGFINSVSVKLSTYVQNATTFVKMGALAMIILTGFVFIGKGQTEAFQEPFEGSNWKPESITLAFYSGMFAYAGWNYLNCMIEEMKDVRRHLNAVIIFSCLLITTVYTLANIAYFTLLTPYEILNSPAVAVEFGKKAYSKAWIIIPIFVAMSTFGSANGTIMTTSRIFYVAGREQQMPKVLSMLHTRWFTPIPSVMFTCLLTIFYILMGNVEFLINYLGFVQWLAIAVSILIVLVFRRTRPDLERPVKVPIFIPVIYLLITVFLLGYTFVGAVSEAVYGLLIILSGVPVYMIGCAWKKKPKSFNRFMHQFTRGSQKLFSLEAEN